jgi:hypothetical protein
MSDPRFASMHLESPVRREDFRRARSALRDACGSHTLAVDADRVIRTPSPELRGQGAIPRAKAPPGLKCWLVDRDVIHPLKVGMNSVGRMPDNDVIIADACISRRHCAILVHHDFSCELHDIASKNGTFINGRRLAGPTRLTGGDEIKICDRRIIFLTDQNLTASIPGPADSDRSPTMIG